MKRVLQWLPAAWLTFVMIRYADTALKAMREPFNTGADVPWARAWLFFLLAAAAVSFLLNKRRAVQLLLVITIAVTVTTLVLSQTWIPALIAMLILLIAYGCGEWILSMFKAERGSILEEIVVTVPIGLGLMALAQLAVALSGHFNSRTSWLILIVLLVPASSGIRRSGHVRMKSGFPIHPMIWASTCWAFFLNLLWATSPEIMFDATSVHLAVPRLYLAQGGVVDMKYFFHSYFAHLLDMFFGICLAVGGLAGGVIVAKLVILALGLLAAMGTFLIGRALFTPEAGVWAALVFYTIPLVMWLSGTTYVDLAETCFIVASLVAFIRWFQVGSVGWLVATGWLAGVAVGTKVQALTLLAPIPFVIAWYSWKRTRQSGLRHVLIYMLLVVLVAGPWYAVVFQFTGNPFFPFMNQIFKSPQWGEENTSLNADAFGMGSSFRSLIRLPFRLTWDSRQFGEALPRGGLGFALLLAFPLAFVWPVFSRESRKPLFVVLLGCATLHLTLWALTFQYGRYFVPVTPLLAIFGCGLLMTTNQRAIGWNRIMLFAGVVIQLPIASLIFWNIPDRFPLNHAVGLESDDRFLRRAMAGYGAVQYLNSLTGPGEEVLGVGMEYLRFYLRAPLQTLGEASKGQGLHPVGENTSPTEVAVILQGLGYKYAITPLTELKDPAIFYRWLQPEFRSRFETEVYRDDQVAILKLCYKECNR